MQAKYFGTILLLGMMALCSGLPHASAQSDTNIEQTSPFPIRLLEAQQVPGAVNPGQSGAFLWLSSHQVINVKESTSDLVVYDVGTGRQTPLDFINALAPEQKAYSNLTAIRTSPDGRWLLWPSESNQRPTWTAISQDGIQHREWPRATDCNNLDVAWMQDSRHWVQVSNWDLGQEKWSGYKVRVFDTETPKVKEYPLDTASLPKPHFGLPTQGSSGQFIFTQDGRAWLSMLWGSSSPTPQFPFSGSQLDTYELLPGQEMWRLKKSSVRLGSNTEVGCCDECALSPDDNWLIWRNYAADGKGPLRLVLTRIDGSEPQTIYVSSKRQEMSNIQWTTDAQHIAFFDNSGIGTTVIYCMTLTNLEANLHKPSSHSLIAGRLSTTGKFPVASHQGRLTAQLPKAFSTALK